MKQADLGLNLTTMRACKWAFQDEMNRLVPWAALVALVRPCAPEDWIGRRGRPPLPVDAIPLVHFRQQRFTLSDPAMELARHDMPLFREFAGMYNWAAACLTRQPSSGFAVAARVKPLVVASVKPPSPGCAAAVTAWSGPSRCKSRVAVPSIFLAMQSSGTPWRA